MLILFCADPLTPRRPDSAFETEVAAGRELGIQRSVVDFEALLAGGDPCRAVPMQEPGTLGIYRGWMLRPEQYTRLYEGLQERGITLVNDPTAYRHCHHLPESYSVIEGLTPRSIWLAGDLSLNRIMEALRPFGDAPVIVKDYVKSQKHYWTEACFIPSVADRDAVERVVVRFLQLQGSDLNEGLVFREFIEFAPLATHSRSGMPLTQEFRLFWLDGEPLLLAEYWEEGEYPDVEPPLNRFRPVAQAVRSRFFTMDVARRADGEWLIVELGDAQVAGLPERAAPTEFYQALQERFARPGA